MGEALLRVGDYTDKWIAFDRHWASRRPARDLRVLRFHER
jgi:hypothetical protein